MKIAITGHRPNKLGNDYDLTSPLIKEIKNDILESLGVIQAYYQLKIEDITLITGMALGIDQLFAKIAVENNISFIAAVPCLGQENKWPHKSQLIYKQLINKAKEIITISEYYTPSCMQRRNEWMVDNCDILIAVWDGTNGGTANCVKYAKSIHKTIIRLDPNKIRQIN